LNDGGTARTITFTDTTDVTAPGAIVTLNSAATSLVAGTVVNVNGTITLNSNNATALGSAATVNVTSLATLNVGASQTVGALNGAGTVNLSSNTLTISGGGTYSGSIADGGAGGGLTLTGGTLALSGTNAYSGATTVNGGSLRINSSLPSTTAVTVGGASATGSPSLGGSGTIYGTALVNAAGGGAAGHLAPSGTSGSFTTTNFANGLTLASGTTANLDGPQLDFNINNFNSDLVNVTGNLSLGAYGILNINPFGGGGELGTGDYPLIDYSGSLTVNDSSTWTVGTHAGDSGHSYSFIIVNGTPNQFDLVVTGGSASGTWISNSNSSWSLGSNWSGGTHPDGATQFATFGTLLPGQGQEMTVSVDGAYTVGTLNFAANTDYALQAAGAGPTYGLALNNSGMGGGPQVNLAASSSPSETILATSLVLADSSGTTTFNVNGPNNTLYVQSDNGTDTAISGSGQSVVLSGGGTMVLASPNTYTGTTTISANGGKLQIVGPNGSIASTSISVGPGGTLQLAGTTGGLPSAANITTHGTGTANDGAFVLTGTATQTVGVISGDTSTINDSNAVPATVYSGNTTVGDGSNAASLTATQILQNTLTINAGSTVTIAPSGSDIQMGAVAATAATSSADTSDSTADSDSSSDPFTAIQAAIDSGAISSVKGQQLENRIAAIERLSATDPGLDVSLLEDRVLAALPTPSVWSSSGTSPLIDSGSGLLAVDSSTSGSSSGSSLGGSIAFAPAAAFGGSPAAVPEPSTLLLALLGGIGIAWAARRSKGAVSVQ
jgi:autotransporter-associated beta strand protein